MRVADGNLPAAGGFADPGGGDTAGDRQAGLAEKIARGLESAFLDLVAVTKGFNVDLGDAQLAAEFQRVLVALFGRKMVADILRGEERGPLHGRERARREEERTDKESDEDRWRRMRVRRLLKT